MKLEDFRAGTFKQQYQYKSFSPTLVNCEWLWENPRINTLLEQANQALGELNAFSLIVPDVDLFIRMHIIKEANSSSRIEGTQTEIDEVLMRREEIAPERQDDWEEVQNYISAMNQAIKELETLPLSNRLLKETHRTLMQGVRGKHKTHGEFRRTQNWIGGVSLADAVFIPPHQDEVPDLMIDLEKLWHNQNIHVPHLIRIAISHYQFETIHPFLDGNGRIGRLLITLYLVSKGLLKKPSLYLSDHLEKHKGAYYDSLSTVRSSSDLGQWVRFFLVAVLETAQKGKQTFQAILALRSKLEPKMFELGRRGKNGQKLLTLLYSQAVISAQKAADDLGVSHQTASALIKEFTKMGILREITGYQRNRTFMFDDYFALFFE